MYVSGCGTGDVSLVASQRRKCKERWSTKMGSTYSHTPRFAQPTVLLAIDFAVFKPL